MLLYIPPSLLNSHKHKVRKVTGSPPDPTTGAPVYTTQPTQLTQTQGKQSYRFASRTYNWYLVFSAYAGTVMLSCYYASTPTRGSWFQTNQQVEPEHESYDRACDPLTSLCVTSENDTALQCQI